MEIDDKPMNVMTLEIAYFQTWIKDEHWPWRWMFLKLWGEPGFADNFIYNTQLIIKHYELLADDWWIWGYE